VKEVFEYYKGYLYLQHIILYGIIIWWFLKKKIKNRFFFGYFFFNFLAVSGTMSHIKYVMDIALKVSIFYKICLFLIFFIGSISVYSFIIKKEIKFLIAVFLSYLVIFILFRIITPENYYLYVWEILAFYLFIAFVILFAESDNLWEINFKLLSILFFIFLIMAAAYCKFVVFPKSFLLSPVGLFPVSTILITIGFLGINRVLYKEINLLILVSSVFIIFSSGNFSVKFYKIISFVGALVLNLRGIFEKRN